MQKEASAKGITEAFANFHKLLDPSAKKTQVAELMKQSTLFESVDSAFCR